MSSKNEKKMMDHIFNMKFSSKSLARESLKCKKKEAEEIAKMKKALASGEIDTARIHGENSILQKNQSQNFLRMSSKIDAVAQKVEASLRMSSVTRNIAGVVKSMDVALKNMNLEQVMTLMDDFERQTENLDIQSTVLENSMSNTTAATIPENQVRLLMQKVADENNIEIKMNMPVAGVGFRAEEAGMVAETEGNGPVHLPTEQEFTELEKLLAKHRNN